MASVIVVDNEEGIRRSLCELLEDAGHTVSQAASVAEAKTLLQTEQVDVVISDIHIGEVTGVDLLVWVQEKRAGLPIILLTGGLMTDTTADAILLGAFEILVKPVEPNELLGVVDRAVQFSEYYVLDRISS